MLHIKLKDTLFIEQFYYWSFPALYLTISRSIYKISHPSLNSPIKTSKYHHYFLPWVDPPMKHPCLSTRLQNYLHTTTITSINQLVAAVVSTTTSFLWSHSADMPRTDKAWQRLSDCFKGFTQNCRINIKRIKLTWEKKNQTRKKIIKTMKVRNCL